MIGFTQTCSYCKQEVKNTREIIQLVIDELESMQDFDMEAGANHDEAHSNYRDETQKLIDRLHLEAHHH